MNLISCPISSEKKGSQAGFFISKKKIKNLLYIFGLNFIDLGMKLTVENRERNTSVRQRNQANTVRYRMSLALYYIKGIS